MPAIFACLEFVFLKPLHVIQFQAKIFLEQSFLLCNARILESKALLASLPPAESLTTSCGPVFTVAALSSAATILPDT